MISIAKCLILGKVINIIICFANILNLKTALFIQYRNISSFHYLNVLKYGSATHIDFRLYQMGMATLDDLQTSLLQ